MKMTSRSACVERYGKIDFQRRRWDHQNLWLTSLAIPEDWFPHWYNSTGVAVGHITVNIDMETPLMNALKAVHDRGLGPLLKTFDGCFNIRMVRGTNDQFSAHSYALAIDINADENPLGANSGGFYNHPEFVECFTEQGFASGTHFHGRKDPMHFSYCFEG